MSLDPFDFLGDNTLVTLNTFGRKEDGDVVMLGAFETLDTVGDREVGENE